MDKTQKNELEKNDDREELTGHSQSDSNAKMQDFENGNLSLLLLKFAAPTMIAMLCGGLQSIINRIIVGQSINSLAIAAVQIGFPILLIFMAFSLLVGNGSMMLISIRMGQKRKEDAEKLLGQSVVLCTLVSLILCIVCEIFLKDFLLLLGTSEAVMPYAIDYMRILLVSMIFFSISSGVSNVMRAQGAPVIAMFTQVLPCVINAVCGYIFVVHCGWGVAGAAWGILIGDFVSVFWIFAFFMRKESYLHIRLKNLRIMPKTLLPVAGLGFTPFLIEIGGAIQNFVMNTSVIAYGGDSAMSVLSIIMGVSGIAVLPLIGVSQGAQPIIGYNYGANHFQRMKVTLRLAMIYGVIYATAMWFFMQFGANSIVSIFVNNEPEVEYLACEALKIFFLVFPLVGLQIPGVSIFQACGKVFRSTFLALSRQFLFFIPCLLILPQFYGIYGCWYAAPVADTLTTVVTICLIVFGLKPLKKEMETKGVGDMVK